MKNMESQTMNGNIEDKRLTASQERAFDLAERLFLPKDKMVLNCEGRKTTITCVENGNYFVFRLFEGKKLVKESNMKWGDEE